MANQYTQTATSVGICAIVIGGIYLENTISLNVYIFSVLLCLLGNLIANLDQDNHNSQQTVSANLAIVIILMLCLYLYPALGLIGTVLLSALIYLCGCYALPALLSSASFRHITHSIPFGLLLICMLILILTNYMSFNLNITMVMSMSFTYGYFIALILNAISNKDYANNSVKARLHHSFRCYDHQIWWLYATVYILLAICIWVLPNFKDMHTTLNSLFSQLNLWW